MPSQWIDVSVPIRSGMPHWPGNPEVSITRVKEIEKGDSSNVSVLSMGSHTGTHVDAPAHFITGSAGIDEVDLGTLIGPARVVAIRDREAIRPAEIDEQKVARGERILFRTRNSTECWNREDFAPDFVHLTPEAAGRLVAIGVRTVGVDYLSVGGYKRPGGRETHSILLRAGITIIEGLDFSRIPAGSYEMICLPLRLEGGDGSPARAVLRPAEANRGS